MTDQAKIAAVTRSLVGYQAGDKVYIPRDGSLRGGDDEKGIISATRHPQHAEGWYIVITRRSGSWGFHESELSPRDE